MRTDYPAILGLCVFLLCSCTKKQPEAALVEDEPGSIAAEAVSVDEMQRATVADTAVIAGVPEGRYGASGRPIPDEVMAEANRQADQAPFPPFGGDPKEIEKHVSTQPPPPPQYSPQENAELSEHQH